VKITGSNPVGGTIQKMVITTLASLHPEAHTKGYHEVALFHVPTSRTANGEQSEGMSIGRELAFTFHRSRRR
jgi:hypothetical protein